MSNKKYTITLTPKELDCVISALAYFEADLEQNDYADREIPKSHPFMRASRKLAAALHG